FQTMDSPIIRQAADIPFHHLDIDYERWSIQFSRMHKRSYPANVRRFAATQRRQRQEIAGWMSLVRLPRLAGNGIDFHFDATAQPALHRGPGWQNAGPEFAVHLVEAREIVDVRQMARALHHAVESHARGFQPLAHVMQ